MKKFWMLALGIFIVGGCTSGPPADPNNICRILADERGWKKDARKAQKRWGLPPHVGFAFVHRESTFRARAKPERKKLLGIVPTVRPSSALAMHRQQTKHGLIIRKPPVGPLCGATIWAMRWISLVGTTTPAISVWACQRAMLTVFTWLITAVMGAMPVAHGNGLPR